MGASQWIFVLMSVMVSLSALAFSRALIFQGRKAGPNQYMTKLLMPPIPLESNGNTVQSASEKSPIKA